MGRYGPQGSRLSTTGVETDRRADSINARCSHSVWQPRDYIETRVRRFLVERRYKYVAELSRGDAAAIPSAG